jgi:PAS domain S-box-containing protein
MQSLNEELSSSNEELQSSNEELETTNEELQSTNEELQTAYSELKVFYEDKDNKAKQLEEFANMLKIQTEDYRKQKELNEAIINTTPIAIAMVDKNGKLNFVNERAQKLFGFSKKELLTRSFDSARWNITDFHGMPLPSEALPFNQVKKTFASVYNVEHAIETLDGQKYFLSVSGAPLFDASGDFLGAVFSLDNITNKVLQAQEEQTIHATQEIALAKELALGYENLKQLDVASSLTNQFNFIQVAMLDMSASIKNRLNAMSLNIQAVASQDISQELREELVFDVQQNIDEMNLLMDENALFYNEVLLGTNINFERLIRRVLQLSQHSLQEHKMQIFFETTQSFTTLVNPKRFSPFLLLLMSALFEIKNAYFKQQEIDVHIKKEESQGKSTLAFVFQEHFDTQVNQEELAKFSYCVKEYQQLSGKKLSLSTQGSLKVLMELV